jgi:hypothetical protein
MPAEFPRPLPDTAAGGRSTRRQILKGGLGLAGLLAAARPSLATLAGRSPSDPPARAKNIIYIFLAGGISQLDLFDPKPELERLHGKLCPSEMYEGKRLAFIRSRPVVKASPYAFEAQGESGIEVSELLPNIGGIVDEIALVRSMKCDEIKHGPAQLQLATGIGRFGRPSLGAWVDYAISTENPDLPGFVTVRTSALTAAAGSALWGAGMLPSRHQGILFASGRSPVWYLESPPGVPSDIQSDDVATVNALNALASSITGNPENEADIARYDLALRMQESIPEATAIESEPDAVRAAYGVGERETDRFGRSCLMARRLVERGVRMVQIVDNNWDHHDRIDTLLPAATRVIDRPVAALVRDLKERGLLDETLVVFATEFGRTPIAQEFGPSGIKSAPGRDHQRDAFSVWLAGAGVARGIVHERTDDLGHKVVEDPVHVHDLNATLLHLLGLDHRRVTYRYEGRDHRLTDVHGNIVHGLLA